MHLLKQHDQEKRLKREIGNWKTEKEISSFKFQVSSFKLFLGEYNAS